MVAANEDFFDCDPGFVSLHSGADGTRLASLRLPYYDDHCGAGVDACAVGDIDGDGTGDFAAHLPRLREVRVLSGKDLAELSRGSTVDLPRGAAQGEERR